MCVFNMCWLLAAYCLLPIAYCLHRDLVPQCLLAPMIAGELDEMPKELLDFDFRQRPLPRISTTSNSPSPIEPA